MFSDLTESQKRLVLGALEDAQRACDDAEEWDEFQGMIYALRNH